MLRIWGRLSSVNVQKVVWLADELGIAYVRIDAGGAFGIVDTPEHLARNPNGLIPVIEDDGFVLYESNAIVRYLAAKHGKGTLWPSALHDAADADRWMEWQSTGFTPAMGPAFLHLVRTPAQKRDAAIIEASRQSTEKKCEVLERHLAGREHLGRSFSVADIVVGCAAHRWLGLPLDRVPRPNLERWYAGLKARPGAHQVLSQPIT